MKSQGLYRLLGLESGEEKLIVFPFLYSFFTGISFAYFVTSATSLFLTGFSREMLPPAFIVGGILVLLAGKVYAIMQKKQLLSRNLLYSLGFLLVSAAIPVFLYKITILPIYVFILYAWIRIFAYVTSMTFWTMSGRIFSLRQGKRLFGLVSAGEVAGNIISFFSVPFLLKIIHSEDILILSIVFLIFSLFVLNLTVGRFKETLARALKHEKTSTGEAHEINNKDFSKYFKLFFIVTFFPVFGQFIIDFIFQSQAKIEFPDKNELTSFVGIFFGISAIIEFVLKTFFAGKMLTKYGLRFGLLSFPVVLTLSFLPTLFAPLIPVVAALFFSFVSMGRLFSRAVRTSFNDPAVQILYQPLPPDQRNEFQNKIESGPKAYAGIVAGALLWGISLFNSVSILIFCYILIVVLFLWIKYSEDIYAEYKKILQIALSGMKISDIKNKKSDIFEQTKTLRNSHKNLDDFYLHVFPEYHLQRLINTLPTNSNIYEVLDFADSKNSIERKTAAEKLPKYKSVKAHNALNRLCQDPELNVRLTALLTCGLTNNTEFIPLLLRNFENYETRYHAQISLIQFGDRAIPELVKLFRVSEEKNELQIFIIQTLGKIAHEKSTRFLKSLLNNPDNDIKYAVVETLEKLHYTAEKTRISLFAQLLEKEIEDYVAITASLVDLKISGSNSDLYRLTEKSKILKKNRIFVILSVMFDKKAIRLIKENFESNNKTAESFALEIADTLIDEKYKSLVLPVFEQIDDTELLKRYADIFPSESLSEDERLYDMINSDFGKFDVVVKTEAIFSLVDYVSDNTFRLLNAQIISPETMIREAAALIMYLKYPSKFFDQIIKLGPKIHNVNDLSNKLLSTSKEKKLLSIEKVKVFKNIACFTNFPDAGLFNLAENSSETIYAAGTDFFPDTHYVYIIFSGMLTTDSGANVLEAGKMFNLMPENNIKCTFVDITRLICFKRVFLCQMSTASDTDLSAFISPLFLNQNSSL